MPSIFNRSKGRTKRNDRAVKSNSMNKSLLDLNASMKSLYSDTYFTDRSNIDSLSYVADKIEDNISAIIQRNNQHDLSNMSRLYSRLARKNSVSSSNIEKELGVEIEDLFSNSSFTDAILSSYFTNKWISDYDKEIDIVLRLLPNLREALDVLKDACLSADSVSKEFINPRVAISDDTELKIVTDRIRNMESKYNLTNLIEDCYDLASQYGEAFVYMVPYNKAIDKLLKSKDEKAFQNHISIVPMIENGELIGTTFGRTRPDNNRYKFDTNCSFILEIDTSGTLMSSVQEAKNARDAKRNAPQSLTESLICDIKDDEYIVHEKFSKMDKTIPDELEIPDGLNARYEKKQSPSSDKSSIDVRGGVVKILDRKNLIRLYVDEICMGYYYFEFKDTKERIDFYVDQDRDLMYSKNMSSLERSVSNNLEDNKSDELMKTIARNISQKLNATFVNANQDLTKEIYAMLKYNDIANSNTSVRVSFLPSEDVKWLRFREDRDLHMGISDIHDGLYPAKMLAMLYVTFITGTVTRGQDKRVYYVKQTIETNIAQTLLNVINQIKKSNFNLRSMESLNGLLNITGKFNDYIIPVGPSGDAPIQFEIMPGQEFNMPNELMEMLEEMAINPIAPLELIQARMNPDFATQYTSSSLKLLRKTYRRQARLEVFSSEIHTDLYAMEYGEYLQIDCELPPPVFLSMINTNQLVENAKNYIDILAEMEYAGDESDTADLEKDIFTKKMLRSMLSSYLRVGEIDKHKQSAKFEAVRNTHKDES